MTGTDLCVNLSKSVPVIFEPPCTWVWSLIIFFWILITLTVFLRSLKARPLKILIFRASTNCPTVGLLFKPQCKWITPNAFSRGFWLRFRVSRYLKPACFNILHTCRTAPLLTSHPFCDGGLLKAGLPTLRKIQLLTPLPALSKYPIWGLSLLSGWSNSLNEGACFFAIQTVTQSINLLYKHNSCNIVSTKVSCNKHEWKLHCGKLHAHGKVRKKYYHTK